MNALCVGLSLCAAACGATETIDDPLGTAGKADGGKPFEAFRWEEATNVFPTTLRTNVVANYNANYCELWVNGFGRGSFANGGASVAWLEAYVSTPPQDGEVLDVGMFVRTGPQDAVNYVMLGKLIERDYWRTGFTLSSTFPPAMHEAVDVAFFIDVERDSGDVVRLWQSNFGGNFSVADTFALPPSDTRSIGGGSIVYANEGAGIFDQKHSCD